MKKVLIALIALIVVGGLAYVGVRYGLTNNKSTNNSVNPTGSTSSSAGNETPTQSMQAAGSSNSSNSSSGSSGTSCSTAQLDLTQTVKGGGAAGSVYHTLVFSNKSNKTCTLTGYPGVSLISSNGVQVGKPAVRSSSGSVKTISLVPGAQATSDVRIVMNNYPQGTCDNGAVALKVYPPNDTHPLTVSIGKTSWCPGFSVGALG